MQEASEILQGKQRCDKESGLILAAESTHRKWSTHIWVSLVYLQAKTQNILYIFRALGILKSSTSIGPFNLHINPT